MRASSTHIQQAGWHLLALINDVLDLSRIEAGTLALSTERVDAARDGRGIARDDRSGRRSDAGITVVRDLSDGAPERARPSACALRQVLINLLSNAVKYNRDDGRVRRRSRACPERACEIDVADTGLGHDRRAARARCSSRSTAWAASASASRAPASAW